MALSMPVYDGPYICPECDSPYLQDLGDVIQCEGCGHLIYSGPDPDEQRDTREDR